MRLHSQTVQIWNRRWNFQSFRNRTKNPWVFREINLLRLKSSDLFGSYLHEEKQLEQFKLLNLAKAIRCHALQVSMDSMTYKCMLPFFENLPRQINSEFVFFHAPAGPSWNVIGLQWSSMRRADDTRYASGEIKHVFTELRELYVGGPFITTFDLHWNSNRKIYSWPG